MAPTAVGRNRAKPTLTAVPGYEVEVPNVFGVAHQMYVAGETQPRMAIFSNNIQAGPGGSAALDAVLGYSAPPSGSAAGATGSFTHRGLRFDDLNWRNVRHWGAKGDGVTDDTAAIQACLDAGTGTVYVPAGTYLTSSKLSVTSGTRLKGAGMYRTIFKGANGTTHTIIGHTGQAGWTTSTPLANAVFEDFGVDGNRVNRSGSSGHCMSFRGNNTTSCSDVHFRRLYLFESPTMGMAMQNGVRVSVTDCYVNGCDRDGISFWGQMVWHRIVNNTVKDCGDDFIALNAVKKDATETVDLFAEARDIVITDNVLGPAAGTEFGNGVSIAGARRVTVANNVVFSQYGEGILVRCWQSSEASKNAAADVAIVGNVVLNTGQPTYHPHPANGQGIAVGIGNVHEFNGVSGGGATGSASRVLIDSNIVVGSRGHGIWIDASSGAGVVDQVSITNNIVRGGSGQDADSSGIVVGGSGALNPRSGHYSAADVGVADVSIVGNKVSYSPFYGIYMNGANIARASILNNDVFQNGQQTPAPGIALIALTDYRCSGNRSRNISGSGQTYGIALTGGAGTNWVNANMLNGNATAALQRNSLTGTNRIWHNEGDTVTATPPPN